MCYYFSTLLGMDGFEQYQDPQRELGGNDSSLVQLALRFSKKVVLWENLWDAGYAPCCGIPPLLPWFSSRRCPAPRFVLLGIGAKCFWLQRLVSHCQATADGKWPDLGMFLLKLKAKKFMTTCQVCVHRVFLSEAPPEKRPLGLPSHGQCWLFGMFNDGSRKDRTVKTKGVTIRPLRTTSQIK